MGDYIVLRNLAATASTASPFDNFLPAQSRNFAAFGLLSAASTVPPQPAIELHSLEEKDIPDVSRSPDVVAITRQMPTKLIEPVASENAPLAPAPSASWGIAAIKADISNSTGEGVKVAILDTGIDRQHAAFHDSEWPLTIIEQDFTNTGNGDQIGHGSHCAGTIFGRDIEGTRVGIARRIQQVMVGKVLDSHGAGTSEMIFKALDWATIQNGAHVVSMSLGFDYPGMVRSLELQAWPTELATSHALEAYRGNLRMLDAIMQMIQARAAFGDGTIVIAAAGNESRRNQDPKFKIGTSLPAAAEGVVSVGALEHTSGRFRIASYSNIFPQISAPGTDILSVKVGGGLVTMSGTSMACPHVAGVASLWWETVRKSEEMIPATAASVLARLLTTARSDVFNSDADISDRGAGIVTAPP